MTKLSRKSVFPPRLIVFLSHKEGESFTFDYDIDGFNIHISFNEKLGSLNKLTKDGIFIVEEIEIIATREEESTPEIPKNEKGHSDFSTLHSYFEDKSDYDRVISQTRKRLLYYFQYICRHPEVKRQYPRNSNAGSTWSDS